jgi:hypothetical protein
MSQNIPISFNLLRTSYPHRKTKEGEYGGELQNEDLQRFMASITGTPCCVQISHAFNIAGQPIPSSWPGQRRPPQPITVNGERYYYLLAVDEMEKYMTYRYGIGELLMNDSSGRRRSSQAIRAYLKGRQGLLVMWAHTPADHTELWDGNTMVQPGMAVDHLLGLSRVMFWDCTFAPAQWLTDYMATQ